MAMRHGGDLAHRRHGAKRVRDLRHRDDARRRIEELFVFFKNELAAVIDRRDAQPRALLGAKLLPGHDVGVVLKPGDDDLVALADIAPSPGLRNEIDPSVAPRTKMMSLAEGALRNRRIFSRAAS